MTRRECIFFEQLRNEHAVNDGRIEIAAAEAVVPGDGTGFDGEGRAIVSGREAGDKHVARAAAEIEHDGVLGLVPYFGAGVGEKIIRQSRDRLIEEIVIGQGQSGQAGGGDGILPLVDLEGRGDSHDGAAGRRPGGLPRTLDHEAEQVSGNLGGMVEVLGGAVVPLLQPHVVFCFVEQIFLEAQAVFLRLGPHPLRAFADPQRASFINGDHRGNERAGERTHLRWHLQRHTLAREFGRETLGQR